MHAFWQVFWAAKQTVWTSENLWHWINSWFKTVRSALSKNRTQRGVFFAAPATIFENVTLVARWREHFRGVLADFFVAELSQKRRCFYTQEFTRFLSTGVFWASNHALWRVSSNKVFRVFGHCWVDIPHIHTSEWDSLFSYCFNAHCWSILLESWWVFGM